MKGKVDSITTKMNPDKKKFEVSIIVVVKDKLAYEDSEKLLGELREECLGKEVDLNFSSTF